MWRILMNPYICPQECRIALSRIPRQGEWTDQREA
jgi:hypothetical protein